MPDSLAHQLAANARWKDEMDAIVAALSDCFGEAYLERAQIAFHLSADGGVTARGHEFSFRRIGNDLCAMTHCGGVLSYAVVRPSGLGNWTEITPD